MNSVFTNNRILSLTLIGLFWFFSSTALHAFQEGQYSFEATYQLKADSNEGFIVLRAEIQDGWALYSCSTPKGGPLRTEFDVLESDQFKLTGPFESMVDPSLKYEDIFDVDVEYHENEVVWLAPFSVAEGTDKTELSITMKVRGQCCTIDDGTCVLISETMTPEFDPTPFAFPETETTFQPNRSHCVWTGKVSTARVAPSDTVTVTWTAEPTDDYKIYSYKATSQGTIAQPTRIAFSKSNGWVVGEITPSEEPKTKEVDGELQESYHDPVSWSVDLKVPEDAAPRNYRFIGMVAYQNCTDEMCDMPMSAEFQFELTVGEAGESADNDQSFGFRTSGSYGTVSKLADRKAKEDADNRKKGPRNFSSDAK